MGSSHEVFLWENPNILLVSNLLHTVCRKSQLGLYHDVSIHAWIFWFPDPKDPIAIERLNLMNMAKLSIKGLIESALNLGRTLDSDYAPLQQFFVVMEHCLKHGLKSKCKKSQPEFHCPQSIHRSSFVSFTQ